MINHTLVSHPTQLSDHQLWPLSPVYWSVVNQFRTGQGHQYAANFVNMCDCHLCNKLTYLLTYKWRITHCGQPRIMNHIVDCGIMPTKNRTCRQWSSTTILPMTTQFFAWLSDGTIKQLAKSTVINVQIMHWNLLHKMTLFSEISTP